MTKENQILTEWEIQRKKWDLNDWCLRFSNSKRHLGHCKYSTKTLSISRAYLENNPYSVMKDTLLHEVAHAVQYVKSGKSDHGAEWKQIAKTVGCTPKRCADLNEINIPKGKYLGICPVCGNETNFYRKIRRVYSCNICSKKFDPRFRLKIVETA